MLAAGARVIHVDIMDGHFVPPLTFGPNVVEAIAEQVHAAGGIIDVHLMIERPERQVPEFVEGWSRQHHDPRRGDAARALRAAGGARGRLHGRRGDHPGDAGGHAADVAADGVLDLALCMSVNPGWGNQKLIQHSFRKLEELRAMLPEEIGVEVDGGVNADTARSVADAGANLLVAGTAVFGAADPGAAFQQLWHAAWAAALTDSERAYA